MVPQTQPQDSDVLAAARSITEVLRENADHGEETGQIAPASIEALSRSGMLSLWRPRALGGGECDPVTYALAAEEIARVDSAAAWLMHGVSATWFDLRQAEPEFVAEVVASADVPVLCETFNKPFQAVPVDGGFVMTGSTPFASGCKSADWLGHTATHKGRFLLVYHPAGALEIREDWDSLGLRGTASNTIAAHEVFVPSHRVIDLLAPVRRMRYFEGALYRIPEGVIPVAVAATSLGILRAALDTATEIAERKTPFGMKNTLKHRPLAQLHFGRALSAYRAARSFLLATMEEASERAQRGEAFELRDKADMFLAYAHCQRECVEAVRLVARAVGTSAVYKGNPIERALRDAEVVSHHAFGAEGRFLSAAQAYWDLDVDFPLLAMD